MSDNELIEIKTRLIDDISTLRGKRLKLRIMKLKDIVISAFTSLSGYMPNGMKSLSSDNQKSFFKSREKFITERAQGRALSRP